MSEPGDSVTAKYSRRLHYIGAILWSSFLVASVGTMFFFAMFDPSELATITTWSVNIDRQWGYTIGFFAFWLLSILSSTVTLLLILPGNKHSTNKQSSKANSTQ